jgi:6-phosphogluconolactonase (cycloisomerase 2 family)
MLRTIGSVTSLMFLMVACGGRGGGAPPTYSIGGTVSGIDPGQSVILRDNGGDDLMVSANGAFNFVTRFASGGAYAVTVTAPEGKTCTVTGGSGTVSATVTNVTVACVSNATFLIGGTVSGLGVGQSVILQNNGGDDLTVSANGAFTFATKVSSGGSYLVKVGTQPQGKYCAVAGGSGTASADVSSVAVACAGPYTVGGTVSGLVGQGLELVLGPQHLGISSNGNYVFPTALDPGPNGNGVSIAQQPHSPTQRCIVQNPYFTSTPPNVSDISDINIVCGEFSFVANSGADSISAFSIDATSGALLSVGPPVAADRGPSSIAGAIDKKYLYVSNSRSNDVSAFAVDASSGALTTVPGSPFAAGTSPRAIGVYSTTACTQRGGHCGLLEYLYVANAGSDTVSAYQIDQSTGVPPLSPASYATGTGPSAMAVRPDFPFLYIANTGGSNDISAFQIDGSSGSLSSVVGSPFPSNGNVSSLAFGAGEAFLYAANASGGTASIMGFSIHPFSGDANDGALTALPGFPYDLPACSYIVADQTGAYLYATAGTNVFGFSINKQTGALSPLPGSPVPVGATADSVSIDPTNQFLYVTNRSAGTVTGFKLNAATGELTTMPGSPFAVSQSADFVATL